MPKKDDSNWGRMATAGLEVVVGVGLGYLVGNWLDRRFGTKPWGLFVSVMLGLSAGMYLLIKDAVKSNKD